jgi:hypothetical protein
MITQNSTGNRCTWERATWRPGQSDARESISIHGGAMMRYGISNGSIL